MAISKQHEMHKRREGRNLGVLIGLIVLVALIFAVTIVKLGPDAGNPSTDVSWGERLQKWLIE